MDYNFVFENFVYTNFLLSNILLAFITLAIIFESIHTIKTSCIAWIVFNVIIIGILLFIGKGKIKGS